MDFEDLLISPIEGCAAATANIRAGDTFQILDAGYGPIEHRYLAIADAEMSGDIVMISTVVGWPMDQAFKLIPQVLSSKTRLWVTGRGQDNQDRLWLAKHLARECAGEMARA